MTFAQPRPPIALDAVLDDPSDVHTLVRAGSPYWSVQRYVENLDQLRALSEAGQDEAGHDEGTARSATATANKPMPVAPWFRGDWCVPGQPSVPGVARFLEHPALIDAARRLMDAAVVRPEHVYVNLNPPLPKVDPGHVDVPCFRGATRGRLPVWLLQVMHKSELFTRWYVPTATAVTWFYSGVGGGFTYWPDGPDAAPRSRPCMSNTALMGDNDYMFHAVEAIGGNDREVPMGLSLDATLRATDDGYVLEDRGRDATGALTDEVVERKRYRRDEVRLSVSWKALCFATERDAVRYDTGEEALDDGQILDTFVGDLRARGLSFETPPDLHSSAAFTALLTRTYRRAPTVFAVRS
ncbi:MAG: hypothetical protein KC668_03875 [Myxococcales bacterium]|nr:hypothetical protein [Myxococcales bacterium]